MSRNYSEAQLRKRHEKFKEHLESRQETLETNRYEQNTVPRRLPDKKESIDRAQRIDLQRRKIAQMQTTTSAVDNGGRFLKRSA